MIQSSDDTGQATVELALVLPLVVLALLAIIQVGLLVRDQNLVNHAAREAARAAAVDDDPAAANRAAERAGPLNPQGLDVEVHGRGAVGSQVTVTVRYATPARVPLVGMMADHLLLDAAASMRVER